MTPVERATVIIKERWQKAFAGETDVNMSLRNAIASAIRLAQNEALERAAKVAEGGRFLHDDAPDARFGKACAAAIRAMKE